MLDLLQLTAPTATDDDRAFTLLQAERDGLSASDIDEVQARFGLSTQDMVSLMRIDLRTYQRIRKERSTLKAAPTAALLDAIRVLHHAEEVFVEREKAGRWLRRQHFSLQGMSPLELLHYSTGRQLIEDLLTRIEYGVYG